MSRWKDLARALAEIFTGIPSFTEKRRQETRRPSIGIGQLASDIKNGRFDAWTPRSGPPPVQGQAFDEQSLVDVINQVKKKYSDVLPDDRGEHFDYVELLGRDASYDEGLMEDLKKSEIRVVSSSNVYSYSWEDEGAEDKGILYVTYLDWSPGTKRQDRSGPGATYAYYDFPKERYEQFNAMAEESAGKAVWDYCRVRGTQHGHQHRYRLISVTGEYIPRKATAGGLKKRTLIQPGMSPDKRRAVYGLARTFAGGDRSQIKNPSAFRRSTLPETYRGTPNRGRPNRGEPNRG